MAQPQINSTDIPYPAASSPPEYQEAYRGAGHEMADGSVVFQWVSSARKRVWRLSWVALTATDMEKLRTAYNTVATNTSTTYKDVNGTTYNVTLDPENMTLDVKYRKAAGGVLRYDVTWSLRQV